MQSGRYERVLSNTRTQFHWNLAACLITRMGLKDSTMTATTDDAASVSSDSSASSADTAARDSQDYFIPLAMIVACERCEQKPPHVIFPVRPLPRPARSCATAAVAGFAEWSCVCPSTAGPLRGLRNGSLPQLPLPALPAL